MSRAPRRGRRDRSAWALGAAGVLLSACMNLAPTDQRPPAPVPATLPSGGPAYPPAASAEHAPVAWQSFFSDPRLAAVIARGLLENRDLRAAAANIAAARAQFQVQHAALVPTLTGQAGATFAQEPYSVAAGTTTVSGLYNERLFSLTGGVASYQLDLFGGLQNLSRAARDRYLASAAGRDAVQISLVAQTASQYLALGADQRLLKVADAELASGEESVNVTRQRLQAGVDSELALSQAQTIVQQALYDKERLNAQIAQDKNALDLLVGAPVETALLPTAEGGDVVILSELPEAVSSAVLLSRPDVLQAEEQLRAANADIGAARAAFFPSITLTGSGGLTSIALSALFKGSSASWSFAPSLAQTLFDGGALRGNLNYAKAQRDLAVANYEKAVQTAFRDVADALAVRGTIDRQLAAQRGLVAAADTAVQIAQARYQSGSDSYLNLLIAQRSFYAAEQTLVQTELLRRQNLVALYGALGGGLSALPDPKRRDAAGVKGR